MITFQTIIDEAFRNNIKYIVCVGCGFVRLYDSRGREYKARVSMNEIKFKEMIDEIKMSYLVNP